MSLSRLSFPGQPGCIEYRVGVVARVAGLLAVAFLLAVPQAARAGSFLSTIEDQTFTVGTPVSITLPQLNENDKNQFNLCYPDHDYVQYSLSPALPQGLSFAGGQGSNPATTLVLSGTPTQATEQTEYTYKGEELQCYNTVTATFNITVVAAPSCPSQPTDDLKADCAVLETLYDDTGGANWKTSTNWKTANSLSTWHGVKVMRGRVSEIDLSNNSLTGTIPDLSSLHLYRLDLSNNNLGGALPDGLNSMTSLTYLFLQNNRLSGELPDLGSSVSRLSYLILRNNRISGTIPSGLGSNSSIRELDLANNNLSGSIPDLSSTPYLAELGLWGNSGLTGDITLNSSVNPGVIDRAALTALIQKNSGPTTSLSNWVTGPDMSTWEGVTVDSDSGRVTGLNLSAKGLSGSISNSIQALGSLASLNLSQNTSLSGTLPLKLKDISALTTLNIQCTGIGVPSDQSFTDWLTSFGNDYTPASCGGGGGLSLPAQQGSPPPAGEEQGDGGEEEDDVGRGSGGEGGVGTEDDVPQVDPAVDSGDIEAGAGGCALVSEAGGSRFGGALGLLLCALMLTLAVSRRGRRRGVERHHPG